MLVKRFDALSMFMVYSKNTMKAWFQYRQDAATRCLAVFLRESANVVVIYFALLKFKTINGWNVDEIFFLFSLIFLTYGVLIIFFTGLRSFSALVNRGEFDRLMLRPRGLLFQVIASYADWFAAIGHGSLGVLLFMFCSNKVGIEWNYETVVYYLMALSGGVLIQGAIFLALAALNFYFIKTDSIKDLFYYNVRKFAAYPISIFPKFLQYLMIYVVPFAFVNFFPAQYFLRKPDMADYPQIFMYIVPFVGIIMYFLAYLFWRYSVRRYKSSGN